MIEATTPEDTGAAEWNLEALWEEMLHLAWELARELERTFKTHP